MSTFCTFITRNEDTNEYFKGNNTVEKIESGFRGASRRLQSRMKTRKDGWVTEIVQTFKTRKEAQLAEEEFITLEDILNPLCHNLILGNIKQTDTWQKIRGYQYTLCAVRRGLKKYPEAVEAFMHSIEEHQEMHQEAHYEGLYYMLGGLPDWDPMSIQLNYTPEEFFHDNDYSDIPELEEQIEEFFEDDEVWKDIPTDRHVPHKYLLKEEYFKEVEVE